MKQTWRWFGPADPITIRDLTQIGVEGVVTALHHIETGAVWSPEEIAKRQAAIATLPDGNPSRIAWDVVESLPVSETIKTRGPDWDAHIANYIESLENLAAAGLEVICYNFMPVLDWTRTVLRWRLPHGGTAMRFDLTDFAVFDIHLLARPGATEDYGPDITTEAAARHAALTDADRQHLIDNVVAGLPGANDGWTLDAVRAQLDHYAGIDADRLRENLIAFLRAVVPTAERLGLRLCCHPDDPPFPLLGLPRIMSSLEDYAQVLRAVDSPANGVTFCTGSLGVAPDLDLIGFIEAWGPRIHFAHLRNTRREGSHFGPRHSFHESAHLDGDTDMIGVIRALLAEETRRKAEGRSDAAIPMRPDHGHDLLIDLERDGMPGYPMIGRMRGLAELRGAMTALAAG